MWSNMSNIDCSPVGLPAKKHHYVRVSCQKGFADAGQMLWRYDRLFMSANAYRRKPCAVKRTYMLCKMRTVRGTERSKQAFSVRSMALIQVTGHCRDRVCDHSNDVYRNREQQRFHAVVLERKLRSQFR